ncbi:hypothetical protein G6F37_003423 [Rhizopus arrhizus]|nr:hypothetical protein G6F38_008672 [Rhizopus arrhizus]KAG1161054.1 hypothetical protein G6F37_003423 [Rhizopus arrhizus]
MSERSQEKKTSLNRTRKPSLLTCLFKNKKKEEQQTFVLSPLGSGITEPLNGSIPRELPRSIKQRRRKTISITCSPPMHSQKRSTYYESSRHWYTSAWLSSHDNNTNYSPPLTPPPLSPSPESAETFRKNIYRRSAYQPPSSSISSSNDEDDDDDEPLSQLFATLNPSVSLLIDEGEEGDDELIPIACLNDIPLLSAAEKYKAKVKAKLQLDADS